MGTTTEYTQYYDNIERARKNKEDTLPYYYILFDAIQTSIDKYEAKILKYDTEMKTKFREEFGNEYDVSLICKGKWYFSFKEASEKLGITIPALRHWCEDVRKDYCMRIKSYDYYYYKENFPEMFEEEEKNE